MLLFALCSLRSSQPSLQSGTEHVSCIFGRYHLWAEQPQTVFFLPKPTLQCLRALVLNASAV